MPDDMENNDNGSYLETVFIINCARNALLMLISMIGFSRHIENFRATFSTIHRLSISISISVCLVGIAVQPIDLHR